MPKPKIEYATLEQEIELLRDWLQLITARAHGMANASLTGPITDYALIAKWADAALAGEKRR